MSTASSCAWTVASSSAPECGRLQVDPFEARPFLWNNEPVNNKIIQDDNQSTAAAPNPPNPTLDAARALENPLSEREMDVARLLATGASNNEIAEQLVISPHTVKVHLRNIYEKLGVSSRTEASLLLLQQGWMALPGVEMSTAALEIVTYPEPAPLTDDGSRPFAWQPIYMLAVAALILALLIMPSWLSGRSAAQVNLLSDGGGSTLGQPSINIMPRWTSQTPLPSARSRLGLALVADAQLYAIGGEDSSGLIVDTVNVYDLARNDWRIGTSLPFPLSNFAVAVLADQVYVAGGTTLAADSNEAGEAALSSSLLRFDTTLAEWNAVGELPVALAGASLVATPRALYLLGGWDGAAMHAEVWQLDLPPKPSVTAADWRRITEMATAHAFGGAVLVGDHIYVAGGYDGKRELDGAQRYHLLEEKWEDLPSMSTPRGGIQLLDDGLAIFAVGGGWGTSVSTLERFDPATGIWSHFPSPVTGEWRNLGAAASPSGYLYFTGGWSDSYLNAHLHYQSSFRSFLPATQSNDSSGQ